jgi:molecular chaperone DnaK (HSP70)
MRSELSRDPKVDIGIDFGTKCSAIATAGQVALASGCFGSQSLHEIDVTILPSPEGALGIPSTLWWPPEEAAHDVSGAEAKFSYDEGNAPILFFKRYLGTPERFCIHGRTYIAREIAALFLRRLKDWAETVTGQKVNRAVVSYPVYFSSNQRVELLAAAQDAGLNMKPPVS